MCSLSQRNLPYDIYNAMLNRAILVFLIMRKESEEKERGGGGEREERERNGRLKIWGERARYKGNWRA